MGVTESSVDPNPGQDREHLLPTTPGGRLASLDVFRGVTVAGMILVNNGSGASYSPLHHAEWDGWTPTDLVFPFFLFIVGVSITFALSKRLEGDVSRGSVLGKIVRRSLIIFGLGIALAGFPNYDNWATIRIPGVLQRIALCYLATSLIFLYTRARGQAILAAGLLLGYWALMTRVTVPGASRDLGHLARGNDLASYLDRLLLPRHIYKPDYDPEGLLSTLPAIATTLLGVLVGHWLRSGRERYEVVAGLFVAGTATLFLGSAWGLTFSINKALWTSSFVLLTGGLAMLGLALCYWLVDLKGYRRWSIPFRSFGRNPIVAYVLAAVFARLANRPAIVGPDGGRISIHRYLHDDILLQHLGPADASLAYALALVLACYLVVALMDAVGLHVRA